MFIRVQLVKLTRSPKIVITYYFEDANLTIFFNLQINICFYLLQ